MIYFIHDEAGRAVKIGSAWNPRRRLSTLQTSTPSTLTLLGAIPGTRRVEKQVHDLVIRNCGRLPGDRSLHISGEWFDDRVLPFVRELLASPTTYLGPPKKRPTREKPGGGELRNCKLVLAADSGETFRESFTLDAASPEAALAALSDIARARLTFLSHTMRVTRLVAPGTRGPAVDLRGSYVSGNCNPREGLSVILNSEPGSGFLTLGRIKQFTYRWFHGAPRELFRSVPFRDAEPTPECATLLNEFARVLNANRCVIVAQAVLPVLAVYPWGIGPLPRGELRSKCNRRAAGQRRTRASGEAATPGGVVYFVQDGVTADVKIGFCLRAPGKRLSALQTGNPNPLRLVGHTAGSVSDEGRLHRHFLRHRVHGEWFSSTILGDVRAILACRSVGHWFDRNARLTTAATPPLAQESPVGPEPPA